MTKADMIYGKLDSCADILDKLRTICRGSGWDGRIIDISCLIEDLKEDMRDGCHVVGELPLVLNDMGDVSIEE